MLVCQTHINQGGLETDTEYTVRVKHQGDVLEDSDWSASTTFTTGATLNLRTLTSDLLSRIAALENP